MATATLGSGATVGDTALECCTLVLMDKTELEADRQGVGGREISSKTKHMALAPCIPLQVQHHRQKLALLRSTSTGNLWSSSTDNA
eukprot:COSAG02_NODE_13121_length_1443_cov_1.612351_1_plen_85_part_10